ncbi:hypothetical protein Plhal304r1_c035g0109721 [Plasmopara halstedii]
MGVMKTLYSPIECERSFVYSRYARRLVYDYTDLVPCMSISVSKLGEEGVIDSINDNEFGPESKD